MSTKRTTTTIGIGKGIAHAVPELLRVAKLAAGLNEHSTEIGPGMLAELTSTARSALAKATA